MRVDRGNLGKLKNEDDFLRVSRCIDPRRPGSVMMCGSFVADAVSGLEPQGMLIACGGDTRSISCALSEELGYRKVEISGSEGVFCLNPAKGTGRRITLTPLDPEGIERHLGRAGFTAGAMAFDLFNDGSGGLIDPFSGAGDLAEGKLVCLPGDALRRDPVRLLVGVDYCRRYSLEPDEETARRMRVEAPRSSTVPGVRIWRKLAGLMKGPGVSRISRMLRRLGIMEALLPEVAGLFDVPQNYYHHLGAWEHTLQVMDRLEGILQELSPLMPSQAERVRAHLGSPVEAGVDRLSFLAFAALVHDIGKASTMSIEESGRIRFTGHQEEGSLMARDIAGRMEMGHRGRSRLVTLVGEHMRLGFLLKEGESTRSRLAAVNELGSASVEIGLLSLADRMATRGEASSESGIERFERLVKRFLSDYFWMEDRGPLVDGADIMIHAGIGPGPEVGRRLFDIAVAQREALVSNRKQALEYIAPDFKGRMR